jgi:hypothetical protein
MKKLILASSYLIACLTLISCTNDEMETPPKTNQHLSAEDIGGGANGQTKIPPPK